MERNHRKFSGEHGSVICAQQVVQAELWKEKLVTTAVEMSGVLCFSNECCCANLPVDGWSPETRSNLGTTPHCKRPPASALLNRVSRQAVKHQPNRPIEFDQKRFLRNLRSARRGAAGGPSDMTAEHFRPLLGSHRDGKKLWRLCDGFSRAEMLLEVLQAFRIGWMTGTPETYGRCARHRQKTGCPHDAQQVSFIIMNSTSRCCGFTILLQSLHLPLGHLLSLFTRCH